MYRAAGTRNFAGACGFLYFFFVIDFLRKIDIQKIVIRFGTFRLGKSRFLFQKIDRRFPIGKPRVVIFDFLEFFQRLMREPIHEVLPLL